MQYKIDRMVEVLRKFGSMPAVKEIFRFRGIDVGHAAYPGRVYTAEESAELRSALQNCGIVL